MTPRKSLSRVRKIEILDRYGWKCVGCGEPFFRMRTYTGTADNFSAERPATLKGEAVEFDHFSQLALGGKDHADNIRPLCIQCHKKKTLTDAKARAKVKRISGQTGSAKRERARKRKLERAKRRDG